MAFGRSQLLLSAAILALPLFQVAAQSPDGVGHAYALTPAALAYEHTVEKNRKVLMAHAVFGCLVVAFFAPLGAVLIRLNIPGVSVLWLHASWQLSVYAMYIIGLGLGIWLRIRVGSHHTAWLLPHAVIGYILFGLITIQPVLGIVHHLIFKKRFNAVQAGDTSVRAPGRTLITNAHLWMGRTLITLGVINGGLGIRATWHAANPLQSESASKTAIISYTVWAGIAFLLYAGVSIRHELRRASEVINTDQGAPAAEHLTEMSKPRKQSLEVGKEILRIQEAQSNAGMDEAELLSPASEKTEPESPVKV